MDTSERLSPVYHLHQAIAADAHYAEPHYHLALYLLGSDDRASAQSHLNKASSIAIEAAETAGATALELADHHQFSRARILLLRAREQQILAAGASYRLGLLQLANGDTKAANDSFALAVACDNGHADAHYRLGCLYQNHGDNVEARRLFELSVTADYAHALAHIGLAEVITAEDEAHLAQNHYLTALDLDATLENETMEKRFAI